MLTPSSSKRSFAVNSTEKTKKVIDSFGPGGGLRHKKRDEITRSDILDEPNTLFKIKNNVSFLRSAFL